MHGDTCSVLACPTLVAECLQVVTELILGFSTSFASPNMLAKQQALFDVLHQGLVALPINLPFTGANLV